METLQSFPLGSTRSSPNDEAPALVAALKQSQIDVEAEKSALARTLHDDFGGLLVAAFMDMGWIANQPGLSDSARKKLSRAQGLIHAAIDMERVLIENLRPTLLDNVGLYSTLRWYMKASCRAAAVPYTESFPVSEHMMNSEIKIGVFRIVQEALKCALDRKTPADLSLTVEVIAGTLHCHLIHQSTAPDLGEASVQSPETSMHHRAERVGGAVQWRKSPAGHREMHLQVPILP